MKVRNNLTQLQVITLASGEILNLPPRAARTIKSSEVSEDIRIKASRKAISVEQDAPAES